MKKFIKKLTINMPKLLKVLDHMRTSHARMHLSKICHLYDYKTERKHLGWLRNPGDYWPLSSELIFYYHKLEKGLCLPVESRRFFGTDAAQKTCRLLREWQKFRNDKNSPVYLAAIETLRAWRKCVEKVPQSGGQLDKLLTEVDDLIDSSEQDFTRKTPVLNRHIQSDAYLHLNKLMQSRRSVRDFDGRSVDYSLIQRAIETAQLSPSACNRQPWHLHFYDDPSAIRDMLKLQNGNKGFGHTIPLLAVLTADMTSFFDASERFEPALDGGLFLMAFLLALQAQGLNSCCLNWCVLPETDRRGHDIGHIPHSEKILTFLAIGYARENAIVPLSARRPMDDVIRIHTGLTLPNRK